MKSPRRRLAAGAALILALTALAYLPALEAGFVWDDDTHLTANLLLEEHGLRDSWLTTRPLNYWPLTSTAFWVENRIWGLEPRGYHAVNVLLHAGNAVLAWLLLLRLGVPGALACALLFALHPVNAESVAWVAQRKTLLSLCFAELSLLAYLAFEEDGGRLRYLWSLGAFALALLGKGSTVTLPLVILLCLWWLRGRLGAADVRRTLPHFAVAAVMSAVEIWFQYTRAMGGDAVPAESLLARAARAGWVVWFYLSKALFPVDLSLVYPRWEIDPGSVAAWLPDLALAAAFWLAWRQRAGAGRAVLFALAAYVAMLLPFLGFLDIYFFHYSLVADHYQYGAILAPLALAGATACRLARWRPRPGDAA